MANHVYSYFSIEEGNEAAHAAFQAFCDKANAITADEREKGNYTTANCFEMFEDTMEMEEKQEWSELMDAIGSKWAYIEECDGDYMRTVSAWGYPQGFFERVAAIIQEADPKAICSMVYDDEGPNFFGSCVYADGDVQEEFVDAEDYKRLGVRFWWDEEEEGEEEPEDFEADWDKMNDIRDEDVQLMIEAVKIERGEINYG